MISRSSGPRPASLACRRTILIAASLASAPELQKNTRSANVASTNSSASRTVDST